MYSFGYGKGDLQVVPDDGYISPAHSPYYSSESAKSPANSVTSTVDSAFDELAEVIPELIDSDYNFDNSYKDYQDMIQLGHQGSFTEKVIASQMKEDSIRESPNMYDAASPQLSDSDYCESLSPSNDLLHAVKQVSAKRPYADWPTSTINPADFSSCEPPKKRQMTESEAIREYSTLLYTRAQTKVEEEEKQIFLSPANEDSGISASPYNNQSYSSNVQQQSPVDTSADQPFLTLDDDVLTNKFSVLAKYLNTEPVPKYEPNAASCFKQEPEPIRTEESIEATSYYQDSGESQKSAEFKGNCDNQALSNMMMANWFTSLFQNQPASSASEVPQQQRSQLKSEVEFPKSAKPVSQPLSLADLRTKVPQSTSGNVVFFNMYDAKVTGNTKDQKAHIKPESDTTANPMEIIRKWKGATKSKRPNIFSHSSKPRLYNFLLELLGDSSFKCIEWLNEKQGIFKFINSAEVARLWGQRKNKPNMKYENFARSLRTYVAKGILTKPRNKLVYQFMPDFH